MSPSFSQTCKPLPRRPTHEPSRQPSPPHPHTKLAPTQPLPTKHNIKRRSPLTRPSSSQTSWTLPLSRRRAAAATSLWRACLATTCGAGGPGRHGGGGGSGAGSTAAGPPRPDTQSHPLSTPRHPAPRRAAPHARPPPALASWCTWCPTPTEFSGSRRCASRAKGGGRAGAPTAPLGLCVQGHLHRARACARVCVCMWVWMWVWVWVWVCAKGLPSSSTSWLELHSTALLLP
jgi:hypothetical protein